MHKQTNHNPQSVENDKKLIALWEELDRRKECSKAPKARAIYKNKRAGKSLFQPFVFFFTYSGASQN